MEVDNQENNNSTHRSSRERKNAYRGLLNKAEEINEINQVNLNTASAVGDILREANALNIEVKFEERIENTDETLLDSMVVSSASGILRKCVAAVDVHSITYDPTEFAQNLVSFINEDFTDPENINLALLLHEARQVIPQVPSYHFVYGAYDLNKLPQPKQKKERVKRVKEKLEKKEPEKVVTLNKEEEGIDEIVKFLYEVLEEAYKNNNQRPINYYDYVIDSSSYANTIENIFYFSFLIRDGKASLDIGSKNIPVIKPMKKRDLNDSRSQGVQNGQCISSITMDIWQQFTKEGLLQQRKRVVA
ncbi:hypothetical protein ABEB36_012531 [Hypothenemus hampei]|uniref:Non-structural maintenance of chromosomes element 4 n=1 Tax=Hypothenemus hampei TaxID=57062 RepID=A0ABD1EBI9_HYPHA